MDPTKTNKQKPPLLGVASSGGERRFSQAAVDYVDALLEIQERAFMACQAKARFTDKVEESIKQNTVGLYMAEDDPFIGGGWSKLTAGPKPFRWMRRVGALLINNDLSNGANIRIEGVKATKRTFAKKLSVWIDDMPVQGSVKVSWNGAWSFSGQIPAINTEPGKPYHILRLRCPGMRSLGMSKLKHESDYTHASLGISSINIG